MKVEAARIHFSGDVFVAVAVFVAWAPINLRRKLEREQKEGRRELY